MTLQELAWQAGIVGGIVALTQLVVGYLRQRRETKWKQAEMGYRLLDGMFDDPGAIRTLNTLDHIVRTEAESARKGGDASNMIFDDDWGVFESAIESSPNISDTKIAAAQHEFDCLLYHFSRFHHALAHKLTTFDSLKIPTAYYVVRLAKHKANIVRYAESVGYSNAIRFLHKFAEWRDVEL